MCDTSSISKQSDKYISETSDVCSSLSSTVVSTPCKKNCSSKPISKSGIIKKLIDQLNKKNITKRKRRFTVNIFSSELINHSYVV